MSERNDQEWLDALAGRGGVDQASSDVREARALRDAILHRAQEEPETVEKVDGEREDALIARARREGLLDADAGSPRPTRSQPRTAWLGGWRSGLAFAACVTLVIGFALWLQPDLAPETVRGVEGGIVRVEARDPLALKRTIIEELRAVGVAANGYEVLGREGVDADLPMPLAPRVRGVLERHRIPAPPDGVLRIEIVAPPGQ
ncbi:MAG TPA: hypothetical protein VH542_09785 [Steroidobacteraceae bacterium]